MSDIATAPARSAFLYRAWTGAAIWRRGFRPFFLGAAVWSVIAISLWPFVASGRIVLRSALSVIDWHAHEMIFGYLAAVVAGFLTTAVPNWTGRLPVAGAPLAGLAALWALGRVAMFESAAIGRPVAGLVDVAFLVVFAGVIAREVIASKNMRNAKVVGLVAALALANIAFHVEDAISGFALYSQRGALALIVMLILLIGGRVTPSFTNNWLARAGRPERPAPFGRFDAVAMGISALALVAWIVAPYATATMALAFVAGLGNLARLSRWHGIAARSDALVLVLHGGFALASLGFLAVAAGAALPYGAAVHVWAVGGAGLMTLAMMTRATLGHSGQKLAATRATVAAYSFVLVALVLRVALALAPAWQTALMHATACAWVAAFVAFLWGYGRFLWGEPRLSRGTASAA